MSDEIKKTENSGETPEVKKKEKNVNEILYFIMKNVKLKIGFGILMFFLLASVVGPFFTPMLPDDYTRPGTEEMQENRQAEARDRAYEANQPPSGDNWFGTTRRKEDLFTQFVYGLQSALVIGLFGGAIASVIGLTFGFLSGYIGGWVDEILMMITNIFLVIPVIAVLILVSTYLPYRGVEAQGILIGCISWPWVARTVRSQTMSLKQRGFVALSKITGVSPLRTIVEEVAPNMLSFVVMVFIILFGGSILYAVALDFIGLGPVKGISLGLMMIESYSDSAIVYGYWWWFLVPGLSITMIVYSMYLMNSGLDEVFNPQLREL